MEGRRNMLRRVAVTMGMLFLVCLAFIRPSFASTLWYSGDFNYQTGVANEVDNLVPQSNIYSDFVVGGSGWTVNSVWSNNLINFNGINQASWEIRSNISSGNGGTIVASGISSATQNWTGRSAFGYNEYTIEVGGLNLFLNPGRYWLTVAPIDGIYCRSFNCLTSGLNSVNNPGPVGGDFNSYWDSSFFGRTFSPTSSSNGWNSDFSMGVGGSASPEPATMSLLGLGLAGLLRFRRKRT